MEIFTLVIVAYKYFMLTKTKHTVPQNLIEQALTQLPTIDFRLSINKPRGNFFYDGWELKEEFIGTAWEELYNSLPETKGEARIIKLDPRETYASHADVDDRFHLNLSGKCCYLINLDSNVMCPLECDGVWYSMDARPKHTAVNFGNRIRYQLVVRKPLTRSTKLDLVTVKITSAIADLEDARFEFDNRFSSVLNLANKDNGLNNFSYTPSCVQFDIDPWYVSRLQILASKEFNVEV